jgi:hypothetical protein
MVWVNMYERWYQEGYLQPWGSPGGGGKERTNQQDELYVGEVCCKKPEDAVVLLIGCVYG